jgi:hypothetical protein
MDPGFYEDRTSRHHGLPTVLEDRPSSEDDPVIHSSPALAMTPGRWRR